MFMCDTVNTFTAFYKERAEPQPLELNLISSKMLSHVMLLTELEEKQ